MSTAAARVVSPSTLAQTDAAFFGHPRGLSTLFFAEMWERFSYYGMRALLILFMTAPATAGGLGFDTGVAGAIYGLYTSMVYLATLPGGWVADRLIGQRRAVLYGGLLIACGHFTMAFPSLPAFYLGLTLIVVGTGFLKSNISVLVGSLYAPGDERRDAGFSIYYMGINLGAFIAPLVCGYLGQRVNWHAGFAAAGIGMTLGLTQYVLGGKYLGDAGMAPSPAASPEAAALLWSCATTWGGSALFALILAGVGVYAGVFTVSAKQVADAAGYLLLIVTVGFFVWLFLFGDWTPSERRRLYAIAFFFVAAAVFWSEFEQAGSTLNLFADRATRTSLLGWTFPSSYFQSAEPVFIILCAPIFAWLWLTLGRRNPSTPTKFALGLIFVGSGFGVLVIASTLAANGVMVSPLWLVVTYLLHTFGELLLSPVGLSAMTKLAPARVASLMMGVWFLGSSVGNFIGGRLASLYGSMPLPHLFGAIASVGVLMGLAVLAAAPSVRRMMGDVN